MLEFLMNDEIERRSTIIKKKVKYEWRARDCMKIYTQVLYI